MTKNNRCEHCGAELPSHYGSCPTVPDDMKLAFAQIDRDAAERKARRAEQLSKITTPRQRLIHTLKLIDDGKFPSLDDRADAIFEAIKGGER